MKKINFLLKGLSCEACTKLVKKKISAIGGVVTANATIDGQLEVLAERDISRQEVENALVSTDYKLMNKHE